MTQASSCYLFTIMSFRNGQVTYCWSLWKKDEKLGTIGSCLPVMHALTGSNTVPNNIWYWKCVCIDCRAKESIESSEKLGYT